MKIAVNRCYGGFSLSIEAELLYAKKKGITLFYYEEINPGNWDDKTCKRIDAPAKPEEDNFRTTAFTKDLGATFDYSGKESDKYYFSNRDISRDDALLIEVIEELGDKASADLGEIRITEIPDGVDWYIEEYDGMEHVAEQHRTW